MKLNKYINNISSLQISQLIRFVTLFLIGVIFTKTQLTTSDIGAYEKLLFIASAVSFFWISGLTQSFLPLYGNNKTFNKPPAINHDKSPEFFNAFLLICFFSILAFIFVLIFKTYLSQLLNNSQPIKYFNLLLIYILISNPSYFITYFYLLKNKPKQIIQYSFISFSLQLLLVALPSIFGYGIEYCLWGLILISALRIIWLLFLLSRYANFVISIQFIKEHIHLAYPLVLSSLLSGSAKYIDGFLVSYYYDSAKFAIFQYGAREFPLVVILANAFSNAMIPEFSGKINLSSSLRMIRNKSKQFMHLLFPVTIVLLFVSIWLYPIIFNNNFVESAYIFNIYLLLIVSRMIFPQTILIGLKRSKIILSASVLEIIINVSLSILFINLWGIIGVAIATVVAYFFEKLFLVYLVYKKLNILPTHYIPVKLHLIYSFLTFLAYFVVANYL